jgi:RES domain
MARVVPPIAPATEPMLCPLRAGTVLFRIHRVAYPATAFSPVHSHRYFDGGRFDSTDDDDYSYLYAGDSIPGTISEALLRDYPVGMTGAITLPRTKYEGRRISAVRTSVDIDIVDLTGLYELRHASQDTWLVHSDPRDYPQTRHWGHWLRARCPDAAGFVWMSKRDPIRRSYVLFEDRCPIDVIVSDPSQLPAAAVRDFDDLLGRDYLRNMLQQFVADIEM